MTSRTAKLLLGGFGSCSSIRGGSWHTLPTKTSVLMMRLVGEHLSYVKKTPAARKLVGHPCRFKSCRIELSTRSGNGREPKGLARSCAKRVFGIALEGIGNSKQKDHP